MRRALADAQLKHAVADHAWSQLTGDEAEEFIDRTEAALEDALQELIDIRALAEPLCDSLLRHARKFFQETNKPSIMGRYLRPNFDLQNSAYRVAA